MQYPVLLPNILSKPLTYESNLKDLSPGDIVVVPLGKKRELGVIWDKLEITSKKFKVKKILNKFRNLKIKKELIQFVNWFATYNLCPRGMVIKMILANFSLDELDRKEEKLKPLKINLKNFELNAIQKKNLLVLRNKNKKFEVKKLVTENKELYGSVNPTEISKLLKEKENIEISSSLIQPVKEIKSVGEFKVIINLHSEIESFIIIKVVPEENIK